MATNLESNGKCSLFYFCSSGAPNLRSSGKHRLVLQCSSGAPNLISIDKSPLVYFCSSRVSNRVRPFRIFNFFVISLLEVNQDPFRTIIASFRFILLRIFSHLFASFRINIFVSLQSIIISHQHFCFASKRV